MSPAADADAPAAPSPAAGGRMPVLFVGHGSPLNAIEDNRWSRGFRALGAALPRPRAVLCVSAHWWTEGSLLTGAEQPPTIHDFGGFPPQLHAVQYPAPGSPKLAARARALLAAAAPEVAVTDAWGLDHGSWSVLVHLLPAADVPVVQLSLDAGRDPAGHLALGRALRPLRDEGVLVVGSGNLVHNLPDAMARMRGAEPATPDWAVAFDAEVAAALEARDDARLLAAWPDGARGRQAHPHPDHWLPLLHAYGASGAADRLEFPIEGFDLGSLSMRSVRWG